MDTTDSRLGEDTPERFEKEFDERVKHRDFHHIFLHGCCYHFALKLNELYKHELRYIESQNGGIGHCWAKKQGGRAIDINGVLDEEVIIRIFDPDNRKSILDISRQKLSLELQKKGMSERLNKKAFKLAEYIIRNHHRFDDAKPSDVFSLDESNI